MHRLISLQHPCGTFSIICTFLGCKSCEAQSPPGRHQEESKPFTLPVLCQAEAGNSSGELLDPEHSRDGSQLPGTLNSLGPPDPAWSDSSRHSKSRAKSCKQFGKAKSPCLPFARRSPKLLGKGSVFYLFTMRSSAFMALLSWARWWQLQPR